MAKKRSKTKTRYVTRAKSVYHRARSKAKGFGRAIEGAIAGAVTPVATKYLGRWGQPAAMLGVGYATKNDTLETLGGYGIGLQIGAGLAGMLPGSGTTTDTGGYY